MSIDIPPEIILNIAEYCHYDTLISLLQSSWEYYEERQLYYILILRTYPHINKTNLYPYDTSELRKMLLNSYRDNEWMKNYFNIEDIKLSSTSEQYTFEFAGPNVWNVLANARKCVRHNYKEYSKYTIEDVEELESFQLYEIIYLNLDVASEYLSTIDFYEDNMFPIYQKEYIHIDSLILYFEKCVRKSRNNIFSLLVTLTDNLDKYVYIVETYIDVITESIDFKLCVEEKLLNILVKCGTSESTECLKLLLVFISNRNIFIHCDDFINPYTKINSPFHPKIICIERYILYLFENVDFLKSPDTLKMLLTTFEIYISIKWFNTFKLSPIIFRTLLPYYSDDIEDIKILTKDRPSYYYMV